MAKRATGFQVDIQFTDKRWAMIRGLKPCLRQAAVATFEQLPKKLQVAAVVNVLCANDKALKNLNCDFRGIDKPTNVLSFPQFCSSDRARLKPVDEVPMIGDIAFGYQYIVAEAKNDNKILLNHMSHLMIHGILHLLGYDHHTDNDAGRMERLEKKIMKQLGLPDPYAENDPLQRSHRKKPILKRKVTQNRR